MNRAYRLGFSEFTTWPWSFEEDVRRYRDAGLSFIEICEFKLPHHDFTPLAALGEHGLTPASVQMQVHSVYKDSMASRPEDPADRLDEMKRAIESSAPYLPPQTPFVVITGIAPDANIKKAVERTAEVLKELGDCAARRNMRIAFEPLNPVNLHTDTAVWGLDQGLDLVERVNHEAVGICIDSWNVWQTPSLESVIEACGAKIFLVQLSDWRTPRSTADRFSLGDGDIPLDRMMRAIRRTGYSGTWVVEILSSFHLPDSLWKHDLSEVLRNNIDTFDRLWQCSAPDAIVGETPYEQEPSTR